MKAAVFTTKLTPLEVREYPLTEPAADTALVSLELSGICGTDLHIWEGAIGFEGPMILGHEFLGRVRALGPGSSHDCLGRPVAEGDLVAVNVIEPCGRCPLCTAGGAASCLHLGESLTYTRSCEERPHFHGGFAQVTFAPTSYLHKLPAGLPAEVAAAFLCAGPTIVRGLKYAGLHPGEHVVVQGSGPVGLFAALYARQLGAASVTLIGSSSHPRRLELAAGLGADRVLDIRETGEDERRSAVMAATDNLGADLVIEASGNPAAVPEGLALLRPRGRYLWAGQYSDRGATPLPTHVVTFNALQIFGSAQFTVEDRVDYFDFLAQHPEVWDHVRQVVTHRYTVDQANDALATVRRGEAIKAVFVDG